MKKLLFTFFVILLCLNSNAQPAFQRLYPLLPANSYENRIHFFDTLNGIVYSNKGNAKTTDGGKHWIPVNEWNISPVYFLNENIGFGFNGSYFCKTSNAGKTWSSISPLYPQWGTKIFALNEQSIFCYNVYCGKCKVSRDGGKSWSSQYLGKQNYDLFFVDQAYGWLSGDSGTIYSTIDSGLSWTAQNLNTLDTLKCIYFLNRDTGWVAGIRGRLFKTVDGGNTWASDTISIHNIEYIEFINANYGMVICKNEILITKDGGTTWQSKQIGQGYKVELIDSLHCYLYRPGNFNSVGSSFIGFSSDFGQNWKTLYPEIVFINSACLSDSNVAWASGMFTSGIFFTNDGGASWENQFDTNTSIECIYAHKNHVWASGSHFLLYSDDYGSNWAKISNNYYKKLFFIDSIVGFGIKSYEFFRTLDGGKTWSNSFSFGCCYTDFQFIDRNNGFLSNEHNIYKTTDGGISWTKVYTNSNEEISEI